MLVEQLFGTVQSSAESSRWERQLLVRWQSEVLQTTVTGSCKTTDFCLIIILGGVQGCAQPRSAGSISSSVLRSDPWLY